MDDLHVAAGPGAPHGLRIPASELQERFSHASGPGGQGVNTTDSRVQLSLDLATTSALTPTQRARALARLAPRLSGTTLMVAVATQRSQRQNRAEARDRLADLLRDALIPATPRRATRPTLGSRRRRLDEKRRRGEVKRNRSRPPGD
ncbi:alternative ribosome rescue aminoacyl-tRNA hydrolase ArfB [Agrococcus sp. SGAir0287]|uniref:alternative ribosome rescue aminoacyl-tRNA hydrolase ArfB n=1 Tax=Agrococcus sp. SGAir0287 TaxID=2070347 RepID=UPI0010CD543A|nr:alternative ribosome rescue aminoacyl-tRNA hydrolase ArfB [Agrococcus sp. SGAir0287]QCR18814.1 aminoacyl-tRNA hydrolase [Agrococcus sp. SGAir0287]